MSIWSIAYDFGTFVLFSIFESVILLFLKHSNFRVFLMKFTKKSSKLGKVRHPKIYVILGKKKNEDSRGLIRLYRWRNYVPKLQDILHWRKHLKKRRKQAIQHQNLHWSAHAYRKGRLTPRSCTKSPRRMLGAARHLNLAGTCAWCWNKMCLTRSLLSFDDNKVLKNVNWIC